MPRCPQCNKSLPDLARRCPSCMADLDLLVDYVSHLQGGLDRAENLTRAGELGQAVWAYLEVLEVDPDNAAARRQVGQVATAVRQFDRAAPGRRWLGSMRGGILDNKVVLAGAVVFLVALLFLSFTLGYGLAGGFVEEETEEPAPPTQIEKPRNDSLMGEPSLPPKKRAPAASEKSKNHP
jgi:hypothetical protein